MGLAGQHDAGHERGRLVRAVGFEQHDPAGVLRLGRAHQSACRGVREVVAARDQHEARCPVLGEPALNQPQHVGGDRTDPLGPGRPFRTVGARDHDHVRLRRPVGIGQCGDVRDVHDRRPVRVVGGQGQRRPLDGEQRVTGAPAELPGRHRAQCQRLDGRHRRAGGVGHQQGDRVRTGRGQPDPYGGRAHGTHGHPGPGERQKRPVRLGHEGAARTARTAHADRVQRRVQQSRVQEEGTGVRAVGEGDLREDLLARAPGAPQSTERRSVGQAEGAQPVVETVQVDRLGTRRRPRRERPVGTRGARLLGPIGDEAGRVADPRQVGVVLGTRVHGQRPAAGAVGHADPHLNRDAALLGHHQRRFEGEVLQQVAAGFVGGAHRQFDERGARQQHGSEHGVVAQPRVRAQGQPTGQQPLVAPGEGDGGAQQRVVGRAQSGGADVTGCGR